MKVDGFRVLLVSVAAVFGLLLYGCGDGGSPAPGVNIHLAGNSTLFVNQAVYWNEPGRSPEPTILESGSEEVFTYALDIAVAADGSVYIVGSLRGDKTSAPVFWKDNELNRLPLGEFASSADDSIATSVVFSDTTLHIAGAVAQAASRVPLPAHWVDGELQDFLPVADMLKGGLVNGMAVSGGNVYHVGIVVEGQNARATYWRNGALTELITPQRLEEEVFDAIGISVAVVGDNVYVLGGVAYYGSWEDELAGRAGDGLALDPKCYGAWRLGPVMSAAAISECAWRSDQLGLTPRTIGVVWKNGEPVQVEPMAGAVNMWPTGLAVVNGQVWVVGYRVTADHRAEPYYWVENFRGGFDANPLTMLGSELNGMAFGITQHGSNVYIGGFSSVISDPDTVPPTLREVAAYWVNGDRVDLEPAIMADDLPSRSVTALQVVDGR